MLTLANPLMLALLCLLCGGIFAAVGWWRVFKPSNDGDDRLRSEGQQATASGSKGKRRILILIAVLLGLWISWPEPPSTPFDSDVWKGSGSYSKDDHYPRLSMADDLIKSHKLKGLNKEQILEMLGEPTYYERKSDLIYWLGPMRRLGLDSEWLMIDFNHTTGVVENYKIGED